MLREIEIDPYNFELYRFKVGAFFETQCSCIAMRRMENKADNEINTGRSMTVFGRVEKG